MKTRIFNVVRVLPLAVLLLWLMGTANLSAQDTKLYFGDTARVSLVKDITSFDEAIKQAQKTGKLIFLNCYASWTRPCVGMDQYVFSNPDFADYLNQNFVCLRIDMQTDEGKALAERYGVKSYACYLVLDAEGEVIHRINRGHALPEFKDWVARALSPKTSLKGAREIYATGRYSKEDLYNIVVAAQLAKDQDLYNKAAAEYIKDMPMAEFTKRKNWVFTSLFKSPDSEFYRYLMTHKADFLKELEPLTVTDKFESFLTPRLLSYACGDRAYDAADVQKIREEIQTFGMPDTCATMILCQIADYRGQEKYVALVNYLDAYGRYLDKYYGVRANIELTFNFQGLKPDEKSLLVTYLTAAAERERGRRAGESLRSLAAGLGAEGSGIDFWEGSFAEALARAEKEGKNVFLDCYTSWCGPCRMMATKVFTRADVGEYFNKHFVCIKVDMEQGEGPALAKRYEVKAYPTMLFLNPNGDVLNTVRGSRSAEMLIEEAQKAK